MVRFLAIFLLVLLALRLIGRVIAALALGSNRQPPRARGPVGTPARRQLAQCHQCGTHFDPKGALASGGGDEVLFCSPKCRSSSKEKGQSA